MRKKHVQEQIYPEILSLAELMKLLRVSYGTAVNLLESQEIPGRKIYSRWRIQKQDVLNWLSKNSAQSEEPKIKTYGYPPETLIKMMDFIKESTGNTKKSLELLNEILSEVNKMR
ncbi:MAG TPA: hypothetical protein DDW65_01020 [Firmicutes bacterium]|jgi:excisionase family DNA binding protein|nr:hypothetical protein [Bacillota bacterium]